MKLDTEYRDLMGMGWSVYIGAENFGEKMDRFPIFRAWYPMISPT